MAYTPCRRPLPVPAQQTRLARPGGQGGLPRAGADRGHRPHRRLQHARGPRQRPGSRDNRRRGGPPHTAGQARIMRDTVELMDTAPGHEEIKPNLRQPLANCLADYTTTPTRSSRESRARTPARRITSAAPIHRVSATARPVIGRRPGPHRRPACSRPAREDHRSAPVHHHLIRRPRGCRAPGFACRVSRRSPYTK